jgi:pilus assembly protein Flp/PilA
LAVFYLVGYRSAVDTFAEVTAVLNRIRGKFKRFCTDDDGATAIEYAMIALLIGLVLIGLQLSIGNSVRGFFEAMANGL